MAMGAPVEPTVSIEAFGAIQADLAAGIPRADVLASARLDDAQLAATSKHWLRAMGEEVKRGRTALSQRYAKAYVSRRPELMRDPEQDPDRLALIASAQASPATAVAAAPAEAIAATEPAPRAVPSYMKEEQTSDRTGPPAPPMQAPQMQAPPMQPPQMQPPRMQPPQMQPPQMQPPQMRAPARSPLDPPTMPSAPIVSFAFGDGDASVSRPKSPLAMTAPPSAAPSASQATPFATPPAGAGTSAPAAAPPPTASTAPPSQVRPAGKGALTGTAMALDIPASFKAVPFAGSDAPRSTPTPSAQGAPSRTAPPSSAPPESLPFEAPKKSAPLGGTMMALDVPASFKAVPFSEAGPSSARPQPPSSGAPPSAAPASSAAPATSPRAALSGTALAFDVPEHLKKIPLTGGPPAPPPPSAAAPASSAAPSVAAPSSAAAPPVSGVATRAPSSPGMPALPSLPPLEEYVRIGVDLASTPAERVDAYLAQARWTRATWASIDQTYRARFAREPELQAAFQNALARERARRAGGTR